MVSLGKENSNVACCLRTASRLGSCGGDNNDRWWGAGQGRAVNET